MILVRVNYNDLTNRPKPTDDGFYRGIIPKIMAELSRIVSEI